MPLVLFVFPCVLLCPVYRLFYQSYLAIALSKILDHVSDTCHFRSTENCIVMTNTLYRCHSSSYHQKIFLSYLVARLSVCVAVTGVTVTSFSSSMQLTLTWFLWCLTLTLVSVQLVALVIGLGWTVITRNIVLTQLMKHYSSFLSKVDVARGRSVPSPPDNKPVQVLPLLNPYDTSPDLKLLLDLIATKSGCGLAVRCLATMEPDFAESWTPSGLQAEIEGDSVMVYWKDAVVINYLASCSSLKVHYGVEVEEMGCSVKTRIISHQEVRFMKQTWRANNPANVDLGTLDDFIYHESFDVNSGLGPVMVRVWTIVNGQLISFTEKKLIGNMGYNQNSDSSSSSSHHCRKEQYQENGQDTLELQHSLSKKSSPSRSKTSQIEIARDNPILEEDSEEDLYLGNSLTDHQFITNKYQSDSGYKSKNSKSSSESNLHFTEKSEELFSRKAKNRKSLPVGHINLAFISEDDGKDPYLLI